MSRKGLFRLMSLLTLVAGLALGQTLNAFAEVLVNQDVPFDPLVTNPCVPEDVMTTSGVFHMVFHLTTSASGNLHLDSLDNTASVKGVGVLSGTTYSISETHNDMLNIGPGEEITSIQDFHYVSAGSTPDFMFHMNVHVTFPPGALVPTANVTNIHTSC